MRRGADEDVSGVDRKINKLTFLSEVNTIKTFRFEIIDDVIHIIDYPHADTLLEIPDDKLVIQLKDMWLHWYDLIESRQCLESIHSANSDIVNKALAQNAIVTFYKCFGNSKFRNNRLLWDKIFAGYPPEAKKVFEYYHDLRNKFIVHDESRYAQVITGAILESKKEFPFIDTVSTIAIAEKYNSEKEREGLSSFYRLVSDSIQWVELKIDELNDLINKQYKSKRYEDFASLKPLRLNVPTQDEMFEKRY